MDIIERDIYALIASGDGIKAREIAKKLNKDRSTVNHYLYNSPYMKDLCYRNENYEWYGLIRQSRPHVGLGDYSGYYGTVAEFLELTEDEWFQMLTEGCRKIGRNLNDTRGLFHSFRDSYEVMKNLFADLSDADVKFDDWEILFELRIKKSRYIRIYADVLVITENYVFSLEFKMNDKILEEEMSQRKNSIVADNSALWRRISSKILRKKEFLSKSYICQMKWEIKFNRNLWKMNLLF